MSAKKVEIVLNCNCHGVDGDPTRVARLVVEELRKMAEKKIEKVEIVVNTNDNPARTEDEDVTVHVPAKDPR